MLRDFNLLATTSRGNEDDTCSELWYLLREIGDPEPQIEKTPVSGLVATKSTINPFEVVEKLRRVLLDRPYEFRYTLRVIPIERVLTTELHEIQQAATELSSNIREHETFRVTVEKRFSEMHSRDIIEAAAAKIEREVDLTNPDKILLIEVIGGLTGISLMEPGDIISVVKEKML